MGVRRVRVVRDTKVSFSQAYLLRPSDRSKRCLGGLFLDWIASSCTIRALTGVSTAVSVYYIGSLLRLDPLFAMSLRVFRMHRRINIVSA